MQTTIENTNRTSESLITSSTPKQTEKIVGENAAFHSLSSLKKTESRFKHLDSLKLPQVRQMRKALFQVSCDKISPIPTVDFSSLTASNRDRSRRGGEDSTRKSMQDSLLSQAREQLQQKHLIRGAIANTD